MDVNQVYNANRPLPENANAERKRGEGHGKGGNEVAEAVRDARGQGPLTSIAARTRSELNASIIQSASEVSLSSGNKPLHLLFSAAVDKLNEILAPELGENAIQKAAEKPEDFTPEKTAERIVSFATAFYGAYSEQHPEMEEEERLNSFMELIGGGIDQGFGEARDILAGLKVLEGPVKEGVDKTYDLVQQGLQAFRDSILGKEEKEEESKGEAAADAESGSAEVGEGEKQA